MNIIDTNIPDVKIFEPKVFGDDRGFFMETFRSDQFLEVTGSKPLVQDNHSKSVQGILRGLQWVGVELSEENKRQLWVPEGFAHGFYVLTKTAEFLYKCTDYYHPQSEVSIRWDDPELAIDWPLVDGKAPQLSNKDEAGTSFSAAPKF